MERMAKTLHTLPLPSTGGGLVPEWIHILPAGRFSGRDGRGPYALEDAQAVIAASLSQAMPRGIPMDYEHQTENAPQNGQPAPASGWIVAMESREDGIWAHVEWTERAAAMAALCGRHAAAAPAPITAHGTARSCPLTIPGGIRTTRPMGGNAAAQSSSFQTMT